MQSLVLGQMIGASIALVFFGLVVKDKTTASFSLGGLVSAGLTLGLMLYGVH